MHAAEQNSCAALKSACSVEPMLKRDRILAQARRVEAVVLRRTADILARYLPPLTTLVVFCRPSPLQARARQRGWHCFPNAFQPHHAVQLCDSRGCRRAGRAVSGAAAVQGGLRATERRLR